LELSRTSAIVTGGASGLGAQAAAALAAAGASVYVFDVKRSIEALAGREAFAGVEYIAVDVTDPAAVRSGLDRAASGDPLRTVVNCAGIAPSERILGRSGTHNLDTFAEVVGINLIGTFNVMTLAAERIAVTSTDAQGQRGVIVNTASIAAYDGQIGQAAYASSKGGIVSLTLPAARDLAHRGIRVMAIAPGIMLTSMMQTVSDDIRGGLARSVPFPSRLGEPSEYADLVLAIIRNDYLNGEVIRLDGALRMTPR
jgi:NAD(P)-dependent dehydrogenase (short-subunit alcohol dehydrogenase family)